MRKQIPISSSRTPHAKTSSIHARLSIVLRSILHSCISTDTPIPRPPRSIQYRPQHITQVRTDVPSPATLLKCTHRLRRHAHTQQRGHTPNPIRKPALRLAEAYRQTVGFRQELPTWSRYRISQKSQILFAGSNYRVSGFLAVAVGNSRGA